MVSKYVLREVGKNQFWKNNAIQLNKKYVPFVGYRSCQGILLLISFLCICSCIFNPAYATNYHITVTGRSSGDGSKNNPWDLATGISGSYGAPGDTIWLHGGVYKGRFVSRIKGNSSNLIVLAQYPGETAIIDGNTGQFGVPTLDILGSYAVYYGFQVMSSSTKRVTIQSGGAPTDVHHGTGLNVYGSYVKLINLIVRDVSGTGIGFWKASVNSEIYGCIIYNNGWQGGDRGHGPGIYSQNETGVKEIRDNVIFNGFGRGIQIYGQNGGLNGFHIEGNTIFNSGSLSKSQSWNIIIGGETAADNITLKDNFTYKLFSLSGVNVQFHYGNTLNGNLSLQNNRFVGGDPIVSVKDWQKVSFSGNSLYGKSKIVDFSAQSAYIGSYTWNNNSYNTANSINSMDGFTYDNWKKYTSFDGTSRFSTTNPANDVIVRPNIYERGSGTIIIFNNQQNSSVEVDLSKILAVGTEYEIRDVENYMGLPLISAKYNGAKVMLPMNLTATDKPAGINSVPHSDSRFGVFIVKTKGVSLSPPVVNQPPTLNGINDPAAINEDAGLQVVNLSGITSGGENQTLSVSAISDNPALIPHPVVKYTSPQNTGSISYTPAANRSGTAKITVIVNDGGASNNTISRTFSVVVHPVNDPPTLNAIENISVEGNSGTQTINLSGITAGPFEYQKVIISASSNNTELIPNPLVSYTSPNATGTLKFTPAPGKSGSATISVKVTDDGLGTAPHVNTLTRTFTITVGAIVNKPPTLNPINNPMAINEDAAQQVINLSGITAGQGESQTLRVSAVSDNVALIPHPSVNYTSPNTTGSLAYKPLADRSGIANITVKVEDGGTTNNFIIQTFKVVVNEINDAPQINAISNLSVAANSPAVTVNLAGINAGPFENQGLTIQASSNNTELIPHPVVNYSSPSTSGSLNFTPSPGKSGSAVVTVTVTDNGSGIAPHVNTVKRTFTINVNPPVVIINKPPTLDKIIDPVAINEDAGQQILNLSGITAGEGESQSLKITATSDNIALIPHPSVNYASPNTTGSLAYKPVADRSGTANITVKVEDGGTTNNFIIQTFKVVVNEINDAPQINAISDLSVSANSSAVTVNLAGINAGPFENQELTIQASSNNTELIPHLVVDYSSPSTSGTLTFTPSPDKSGSAVVTVTVTDNGSGIAPHVNSVKGTFTINVSPPEVIINKHPTLDKIIDPVAIDEDAGQQIINLSGITAGEGESQQLKVSATSDNIALIPNPTVNYTSPNTTGSLIYKPVADRSGTANITVKVDDGGKENNIITRTFQVVVKEVNDAPQFHAIANVTLPANSSSRIINLTGINAGNFESQELSISASSDNKTLIPDPVINYTSPSSIGNLLITSVAGKSGSAVITVTVTDNGPDTEPHVNTFSRTFTVTINELPPSANKQPTLDPIQNPAALRVNSPVQTVNLTGISAGEGDEQTLKVTAATDNKWLISNTTIQYSNPKSTGTLKFTPVPRRSGTANIIVTVDDGGAENNTISRTFTVTVIDINNAPQINVIDDVVLEFNSEAHSIHLTGINAGSNENQKLTITATSSNKDLVPDPEIKYNSPASSGRLILNPVAEKSGSSEITVTVTDDGPGDEPNVNTFSRTFMVTVKDNPRPQEISPPVQVNFKIFNTQNGDNVYDLSDGLVLDVNNLPADLKQLSIKAEVNSTDIGSVVFDFNGIENYHLDEDAPFEISGSDESTKYSWKGLNVGNYTVTAKLYKDKKGKEHLSEPFIINFTIIDPEDSNPVPKVSSITRTYGYNTKYSFKKEDFNTAFVDKEGLQLQKIRIVSLPYEGTLEWDGSALSPGTELILQDINKLAYLPREGSEKEDNFIWSGSNGIIYASNVASVKLIPARELIEKFEFKVAKFYPNPVQDQLSVEFTSPKANLVNIQISDVQGQVRKTFSSMISEGENQLKIETFGLNSGIYMVTIVNDQQTQTFKIFKGN